jgi:hypothetical protein
MDVYTLLRGTRRRSAGGEAAVCAQHTYRTAVDARFDSMRVCDNPQRRTSRRGDSRGAAKENSMAPRQTQKQGTKALCEVLRSIHDVNVEMANDKS